MIKLKYPKFWSNKNLISYILLPFSCIYLLIGYLRKIFTNQIKLPQKIICVGNITIGGSGKTQVVAWLANKLSAKKISFVIVTKAYKSNLKGAKIVSSHDTALQVGDESVILAKFGTVIAAKELRDAIKLINQLNPDIVILDDGMQNPLFYKDLVIVVFDALNGVGNNLVFPAGCLRQSLKSGLRKANLIFIIGNINNNSKIILEETQIQSKKNSICHAQIKLKENFDKNIKYIAFAGIGNPDKFYFSLNEQGLNIIKYVSFGDHHSYSTSDLDELISLANKLNCKLITTEKDYVKIPQDYKKLVDCAYATLEFENENKCIELVYEKIL